MNWWRIEFTGEGGIKSCDKVEAVQQNKGLICFVQGPDATAAVIAAKTWIKDYRTRRLATAKAANERAYLAGKCVGCRARPHRQGKKTCQQCQDKKSRLPRGGRGGQGSARPTAAMTDLEYYSHVQAQLQAKRTNAILSAPTAQQAGRLCRLPLAHIVLEHFDRLGPDAFRAWLVEKIEASKSAPGQSD
jgi:hypothetical protein